MAFQGGVPQWALEQTPMQMAWLHGTDDNLKMQRAQLLTPNSSTQESKAIAETRAGESGQVLNPALESLQKDWPARFPVAW